MTDFNGYTIAYPALFCDDCDLDLTLLTGQVSVNFILSVISEHDSEEHSD